MVNYEEGGENNILHGDRASEAFLSEIVGAAPWPGQRHMNMESIYEYGSRAGFWRLWRMFTERDMPVTVFGVATALQRNPEAVAAMKEADWEIASHGLKWIDYKDFARGGGARASRRGDPHPHRGHRRAPARLVHGPHLGTPTASWRRRAAFSTRADSYADELPYWEKGERADLIVPYTLDANDMRFGTPQGFNSRRPVLRLSEGHLRHALCGGRDARRR